MDKQKIIILKEIIKQEVRISELIWLKRKEFDEQNKKLFETQDKFRVAIVDAKNQISEEAKIEFKDTGEKTLLGGIGIRVGTELIYAPESALEWAKQHNIALQLDKKSFETIAKTNSTEMDFLERKEKIVVTFPKVIKID